jgi:hypothetical protein
MLNLNGDVQLSKHLWFCLFSYIKGILLKSSDWNLHSINIYKNSFLEFPVKFLFLSFFLSNTSFSFTQHSPMSTVARRKPILVQYALLIAH